MNAERRAGLSTQAKRISRCAISSVSARANLGSFLLASLLAAFLMSGCAETAQSIAQAWENYTVPTPSAELQTHLLESPSQYPSKVCIPYDSTMLPVDEQYIEIAEDGSEQLCIWHHPSGCAPEGYTFMEVGDCNIIHTQGPSWFMPPKQIFETDPELFKDEDYRRELEWTRSQVASSACSCCHSSVSGGFASKWDIDTPGAWTDTLTMTGVVMGAGLATEHKYLGFLEPETNFGFDRETTIFATNDIPRMQAFFKAEFERRGGTEEDIAKASQSFIQINGSLFEEPTPCGPEEGVDVDGRIFWKGTNARQVYIQELGSKNPGSPPLADRPEGTLWAVYGKTSGAGIESGTLTLNSIPESAEQILPLDAKEPPALEEGKSYRLFATPDFMVTARANCIFTLGEGLAEPEERTCESDNTVCATVEIPEEVTENPERIIVALYKTLPPLGPPDVFPPFQVDSPELAEGVTTLEVMLEAETTGTYQVYAVLYMPGGGLTSWQAVSGIDYVAASEAITLDGKPLTIEEPLKLQLFDAEAISPTAE